MAKSMQDYRELLKNHIILKKQVNSRHSQSFYAKKVGVSKSYLTAVFTKKKHLSAERLDKLCECLRLNEEDTLSVMIPYARLCQSQKHFSKTLKQIQMQHRILKAAGTKRLSTFSGREKILFSDELRSTLFSLMPSIPQGDVQKAHEALRCKSISLEETKDSVAWLVKNGFLRIVEDNGVKRYEAIQSYVRSQKPASAQKYIPWLENSIQALSDPPSFRPMRIQSMTFSFDENTLEQLHSEYSLLIQRIQELDRLSQTNGKVFVMHVHHMLYTLASAENSEP